MHVEGGARIPLLHRLVTSVTCVQAVQPTYLVTINGSNQVTQLKDLSGNGKHYVQNGSLTLPGYTNKHAANGLPSIDFANNTTNSLNSTLNLAAPGTQPIYVFGVMKHATGATASRVLNANSGTNVGVCLLGASQALTIYNGVSSAITNADGNVAVFECYWSNSTADFVTLGSSTKTGTNTGNNALGNGRNIGANSAFNCAPFSLFALAYWSGLPTTTERANLKKVAQKVWLADI